MTRKEAMVKTIGENPKLEPWRLQQLIWERNKKVFEKAWRYAKRSGQ